MGGGAPPGGPPSPGGGEEEEGEEAVTITAPETKARGHLAAEAQPAQEEGHQGTHLAAATNLRKKMTRRQK